MRNVNPLYPNSDDSGINGAYQQAAFIDDTENAFGSNSKQAPAQNGMQYANSGSSDMYKKFNQQHRAIFKDYKRKLQQLRTLKKTGKITSAEYRDRKRQLVKKTDKANVGNFKQIITGE